MNPSCHRTLLPVFSILFHKYTKNPVCISWFAKLPLLEPFGELQFWRAFHPKSEKREMGDLKASLDFHTTCTETFLQTTQGVQINCFRTLEDLVLGYQHPHKGLVSPLLYGVPRDTDTGDESSGAPSGCNHVASPSSMSFVCHKPCKQLANDANALCCLSFCGRYNLHCLSCWHRWWEDVSSVCLCQRRASHSNACKTNPPYIPGQVAGAENVQVLSSAWIFNSVLHSSNFPHYPLSAFSHCVQDFIMFCCDYATSWCEFSCQVLWMFAFHNEEMCTLQNRMLCFVLSCSSADDVIGILSNYLLSELPLDIENVHRGAMTLRHLKCTLGTACQGLHRSALFTLLLVMSWK